MQSRKKCSVESSLGDSASITLHSLTATVNTTLIVGTWNTHAPSISMSTRPNSKSFSESHHYPLEDSQLSTRLLRILYLALT